MESVIRNLRWKLKEIRARYTLSSFLLYNKFGKVVKVELNELLLKMAKNLRFKIHKKY